jgi:hypothetical protein
MREKDFLNRNWNWRQARDRRDRFGWIWDSSIHTDILSTQIIGLFLKG